MSLVPRVVIGDRLGNGSPGLHVAKPGVNALTADTLDPTLFSFSTDWPLSMRIIDTGTVACNVWVSFSVDLGYMPYVVFRRWNGGSDIGYFNRSVYFTAVSNRYDLEVPSYRLLYRIQTGVRQFQIANINDNGANTSASQSFLYFSTNLSIDP